MFEEGFKRYDSVRIIKVFSETEHQDASITYEVTGENIPRFALIREVNLEEFETVNADCSTTAHKISNYTDSKFYIDAVLKEFARALKEDLPVNLVIAVLKKGHNVEFVSRAEFI